MTRLRSVAAAGLTSLSIAAITAAGSSAGSSSARQPLLGLVQSSPGGAALLARLDPISLRPVSRGVEIDEYHDTWSFSPARSRLALGVSAGVSRLSPSRRLLGRIGIYIVDLRTMRLVREIETGVAAEAVAWLSPRMVVAALQRGGTVLVDPLSGKIVRRWSAFSFPDASARVGTELVMLVPRLRASSAGLPLERASGHPRLVTVTVQGRLRSVALRRIRLVVRTSRDGFAYGDNAALAVDQKRKRAYVFAAGTPAAEVDLRTMHVTYHDLGLSSAPSGRKGVLARDWDAIWLGESRALVVRRDFVHRGERLAVPLPAGATLVNTATWTTRGIDPHAGRAGVAGRTLLLYDGSTSGPGVGLTAYTFAGRSRFALLHRLHIADVRSAASLAYVRTVGGTTYIISVATPKVVGKLPRTRELVDVIAASG